MQARPYQTDAILATRNALNKGIKNPLVCLPTGSGKGYCITKLAHTFQEQGRDVTVFVHTQELITQLAQTYERISGLKAAIFSASLGEKNVGPVTFAQIQSAHRCPGLFSSSQICIVDECDRHGLDTDSMYSSLFATLRNIQPNLRVIGFTATPYRLGTGLVYGPGQPFDSMVYDANVGDLIKEGYLCQLRTKQGTAPDLSGVHVRAGEYVSGELELAMSDRLTIEAGVSEIIRWGQDRHSWLLFCSGVKHALAVQACLKARGVDGAVVTGETSPNDRNSYITGFKEGSIRCLINCMVLTVGFDAPNVDLIAMLRPTMSAGLYMQILGRGLRKHTSKCDTLVLDLSGNIERHGPIDTLNDRIEKKSRVAGAGVAPVKACPECCELIHASVMKCPSCGYIWTRDLAKHGTVASHLSVLSELTTVPVTKKRLGVNSPSDRSRKQTLKVEYFTEGDIVNPIATEFISLDTTANPFAYSQGVKWLRDTPGLAEAGLVIDGDKVLGKGVHLKTVLDVVPFVKNLPTPKAIKTMPNSNNPKYRSVIARVWE